MSIQFVTIIYNPKSSGEAKSTAQRLYRQLRETHPDVGVELKPTKYAGHAQDLSEIIGRSRRRLIVAVGGDGTFHEVVNGIMKIPSRQRPTCLAYPAGNANDHAREMGIEAQAEIDPSADTIMMDVLKVTVHNPIGDDIRRFAHSYVGFGASGRVARWLDRNKTNPVLEKLVTVRELLQPKPFKIVAGGRLKTLYSLICGNIGSMGKYVTLSKNSSTSDGVFEVNETIAGSRLQLLKEAAQAAGGQNVKPKRVGEYSFLLITPVQAQFDGEPVWLPQGAQVTVSIQSKAIRTLALGKAAAAKN